MSNKSNFPVSTMEIDIGKNALHVVGLDRRGAIVLRQTWSRGQVDARLANRRAAELERQLWGPEPDRFPACRGECPQSALLARSGAFRRSSPF